MRTKLFEHGIVLLSAISHGSMPPAAQAAYFLLTVDAVLRTSMGYKQPLPFKPTSS
jgi:hypothetical protein